MISGLLLSKMLNFIREELFEELIEVCFDLFSGTRLHPHQVQVSAFLPVQHTAFQQLQA